MMLTERRVLDLIEQAFRQRRLPLPGRGHAQFDALMDASRRIASECQADCRAAARTASMVGFSITRGRPRL